MDNTFSRPFNIAVQLGKRKASESDGGDLKKTRREIQSDPKSSSSKTLLRGEEQLGGLVILRNRNGSKATSAPTIKQAQSQPTQTPSVTAGSQPTEEQAEEDIRHMEAELSQLRERSQILSRNAPSGHTGAYLNAYPSHKPLSPLDQWNEPEMFEEMPLQETPINQKNKKLRTRGKRSSNSRSKRLSSSLGNTGVITQPHPSIPASSFHKHLAPTLPDAFRLRHLLVWCANRNLLKTSAPTLPDLPALSSSQLEKLKTIQTDFIKSLAGGRIETAVVSKVHESPDTKARLEEHEQNTKNKQREANFLRDISSARSEESAWVELIHSYNTRQASTLANLEQPLSASTSGASKADDWRPREPELDERFREGLSLSRVYIDEWGAKHQSESSSPISSRVVSVQFQVDQLYETLHASSQLANRSYHDLDTRFQQLSRLLEFHRSPPPMRMAVKQVDPRELLRSIAQTDVSRIQEMGEIAGMTAREVTRLDRSVMQSFSGTEKVTTLPSTPRTPRRAATPNSRGER